MRFEKLLRFLVLPSVALTLGVVAGTSCVRAVYQTYAFRCNPRQSDNCPTSHFCCSDDPSTADGKLPRYQGRSGGASAPIYADTANNAGTTGMCVNLDDISPNMALPGLRGLPAGDEIPGEGVSAAGCPIPCNPTWDTGDVNAICGAEAVCCQTVELSDKDCVLEDGKWRPVTGADVGRTDVTPTTNWSATSHDTHQDPSAQVCLRLAGNDQGSAEFKECIKHLTVADQRGFCMPAGTTCPAAAPDYVDACELKNQGGG